MLVAAGFGTRLDPLTRELPKPALPVGNRPIASFGLDVLARAGVDDVVVNTHHLGDRLRAALEGDHPRGTTLRFVHEPHILGTGGGVRNAWHPVDGEEFVVWNAKLLFEPDLARALEVHRQTDAIATLVLRELPAGSSFSPVEVDAEGRVLRIRAEPRAGATRVRMFTGVQILSARAHRDLPLDGDVFEHAYLPWLARGEYVASVSDDAPWMDVGVALRHYADANVALANAALRWPGITPTRSGIIASAARIGDGT
jgi:NDP-sugar pyrophosphorylase family protein